MDRLGRLLDSLGTRRSSQSIRSVGRYGSEIQDVTPDTKNEVFEFFAKAKPPNPRRSSAASLNAHQNEDIPHSSDRRNKSTSIDKNFHLSTSGSQYLSPVGCASPDGHRHSNLSESHSLSMTPETTVQNTSPDSSFVEPMTLEEAGDIAAQPSSSLHVTTFTLTPPSPSPVVAGDHFFQGDSTSSLTSNYLDVRQRFHILSKCSQVRIGNF
ncbi:hypothetical protein AB6A40_004898 [Gnathostoma spinigerum]|uniref:Uncharacterized protein n=1 Tax=Gnathostoma spinigerum TaxID=75299 RepID=A0ABD6EJ70_9BILA